MSLKDMFSAGSRQKWLLASFAAETLCATYCLKINAFTAVITIIYFLAGIAIAVLITSFPQIKKPIPIQIRFKAVSSWFKLIIFIIAIVIACFVSRYWFDLIPLDPDYADMLPVIKVMDQRLIAGQWTHMYDNIPEIWNGTRPIYLPAMWLPFTPAILFHFDMRWITTGCLIGIFSLFLFMLDFDKKKFSSFLLLVIGAIFFWWLMGEDEAHGFLSMSEEGIVALYYVFLVMAISSGNIVSIGIATSLCMLSRYALIGWIPAFILYLLLNQKKRELIIFVITGMICFLVLFVLPFGWRAFVQLSQLPGYYIEFAKKVWENSREVFWLSLGFAKFFGPANAGLQHTILIVLKFIVPLFFVVIYFKRNKQKKIANIPLASLKISLVFFYNFIDVPYLYLFYTSSFVSLIIVARLMQSPETILKIK